MPNGATSGVSDSIHPSTPDFDAAHAVQNSWPRMPAVDGMVTTRPDVGNHHRQDSTGDVSRAEQGGLDLGSEVLGSDLFQESSIEIARVVDHHVEPTVPAHGSLDRGVGSCGVGDIQSDRRQIVVLAESGGDAFGIPCNANYPVASCGRSLSDVDTLPRPAPVTKHVCFVKFGNAWLASRSSTRERALDRADAGSTSPEWVTSRMLTRLRRVAVVAVTESGSACGLRRAGKPTDKSLGSADGLGSENADGWSS
jgi:hypothetical protein